MKILLLTNLFSPFTRGGAERIAERQADLLAEAGHDVLVLSPTPDSRFVSDTRPSGVRVIRFHEPNVYFSLQDGVQPFWKRAIWHLVDLYHGHPKKLVSAILKRELPDVVVTHNMKGFGLRAFEALREAGIPHVHVLHDLQLIVPSGLKIYGKETSWQASGRLQRFYARATARRLGSPHLVVSPSCYLLDEYRAFNFFPKSETCVLPNPAPWDVVRERHPLGQQENSETPFVLYVGQLGEHKGLRVLMEAWGAGLQAQLGIVGAGELQGEVQTFAEQDSSVTSYGRKSPSEVKALMSRARLVIVPSLCYENAPTVIMEALSLGTPVVASRIGGIPELVEDGEGVLVEPGNVEALREAIRLELSKPLDREKIKTSAERFSVEEYKERFLSLIARFA